MELKRGYWLPELRLAAMGLVKIKKGKTNLIPRLEGFASCGIVNIQFWISWLLGSLTKMSDLNRSIQFKPGVLKVLDNFAIP